MDPALLATLAVLAALLVVGLVAGLALLLAGRRRLERELRSSRQDLADVRVRLEQLATSVEASRGARPDAAATGHEYVITSLPDGPGTDTVPTTAPADGTALSGAAFASLALSESVVRVASLAHGVRRALSAENRNRIRFEVRREVRRSRKRRRLKLRETRRHLRAQQVQQTQQPADVTGDAA
jgi:hypothetical protein